MSDAQCLQRVDGWWWDGAQYRRVDPHDEEMPLDTVRALAALAGLALVPAADVPTQEERAVLEAALRYGRDSQWSEEFESACDAVLARRAAKEQGT